ncbi:MAG: type II toxin-antitoxin system VapC family toxin [Myxococcales bacterium]|nr:type II toxin-antitoxin system VapC family toxin [Myxococcales bacterium]
MSWVLDTNVVAAVMRGDEAVLSALERVRRDRVRIPEPVFAELAYWIARLAPSRRRALLESRLALVRSELASAAWTEEVSDTFGAIKAELERRGLRLEDFDVAIAAHAVASGATLVTSNVKHLRRVEGLRCETWGK